jgi:uroporphyrin-III C-methyltransferase
MLKLEAMIAKVTLVGAGPGAADLLTLRALKALHLADVVLHDALVSDEILALIPMGARKISVGKRGHKRAISQDFTNALMVKLAKAGQHVVRLKGGDPSVFGRAGEERAFLEERGVAVEVVPGITTASAAAAQFGFSLTKRGSGRKVMLATGHTLVGRATDWAGGAAQDDTTLCLYMAHSDMASISEDLMRAGRPEGTPAIIMTAVSRPHAKLINTTLSQIGVACGDVVGDDPVFIVIGEVCASARPHEAIAQLMTPENPRQLEGLVAC